MKTKIVSLLSAAALFATSASAISVDVELALVIDVSSSISNTEWQIQKDGYEAAFRNAALQDLITNTPNGVAVSYIVFGTNQQTRVPWTHLTDAASATAFADSIAALSRLTSGIGGLTEIAGAITFASNSIASNDYEGTRKIIDISGDGKDNRQPVNGGFRTVQQSDADKDARFAITGQKTADAAQDAIDSGIDQINGLPIITPEVDNADLQIWYETYVLAGVSPMIFPANDFDDLAVTILEKITTEIDDPDPVPDTGATAALLGFGLLVLGAIRRRIKH